MVVVILTSALITGVISTPVMFLSYKFGIFEKPVKEIISCAKSAGCFARAQLLSYSRGSSDEFILTYGYEVDGHKYECVYSTYNCGIDEFVTVYWKKNQPSIVYIEGQQDLPRKHQWLRFLPFTLFVVLLWLMSLVFGVERLV